MNQQPKPLIQQLLDILRVVAGGIVLVVILSFLYTVTALFLAERGAVYPSPEAGMQTMIAENYIDSKDSQVIYAGSNSFDGSSPHVAYVIACIWGGQRLDGTPTGTGGRHAYDQPGQFYLNTKHGWVFMPEGFFPTYIGFWMDVFGMAGPGLPEPSINWGSVPDKGCEF